MKTNREKSYIESHDFWEINVCLTQTIVKLTYLFRKVSYLNLSDIDHTLMTDYLLKEIEDISAFCITTTEKYFPNSCSHLPDKALERIDYYANYYFGFTIDGLDFLALYLQKDGNDEEHILEELIRESFKSATKMLETIFILIDQFYKNEKFEA